MNDCHCGTGFGFDRAVLVHAVAVVVHGVHRCAGVAAVRRVSHAPTSRKAGTAYTASSSLQGLKKSQLFDERSAKWLPTLALATCA